MKIIKIASDGLENTDEDFRKPVFNKDVFRLYSTLAGMKADATMALKEMDDWIMNGESNISFEEAKNRLSYHLQQLGLKD